MFDATKDHGGNGVASSPMVVMLEAMAACSFLDVLAIMKKKRKQALDAFQKVRNLLTKEQCDTIIGLAKGL